MTETTGERLNRLRGNRRLDEVAKAVGITPQYLSMIENDRRIPSDRIKRSIAAFYDRSVNYIFFKTVTNET